MNFSITNELDNNPIVILLLKEHPEFSSILDNDGKLVITDEEDESVKGAAKSYEGMFVKKEAEDFIYKIVMTIGLFFASQPDEGESYSSKNIMTLIKGYWITGYPFFLYIIADILNEVGMEKQACDFYGYFLKAQSKFEKPTGFVNAFTEYMVKFGFNETSAIETARKSVNNKAKELLSTAK